MFDRQQAIEIVLRWWSGLRVGTVPWIKADEFPTHWFVTHGVSLDEDDPDRMNWVESAVVDKETGTMYWLPTRYRPSEERPSLDDYPANRERLRRGTLSELVQLEEEIERQPM